MTDVVETTLAGRGSTHGDYNENSRIIQELKAVMEDTPNWQSLPAPMKECLQMVAHKIGRILAGNPMEPDHWLDIMGYVRLVHRELPPPTKA